MSTSTLLLSRFLLCTSRALPPRLHHSKLILRCQISSSSSSSSLTHSITLPSQPSEPVLVSAAAGISSSDFRDAIDSCLFRNWLKDLESETGILADGSMKLRQVLIQGVDMFGKRIGFLKFKADIFDKETGVMVPGIVFSRGPAVAVLILLDSDGNTYAVLTEQVAFLLRSLFWNYLLECWMLIKVTLWELQFVRSKRR